MGPFSLKLYTAPTEEPVTLDEAKARLRVTVDDEDDDIQGMIEQSRALAEAECGRALATQTWTMYLDRFPCGAGAILIPRPPLRSVTHVKYYDADGIQQTVDPTDYWVATGSEPGRIVPADGGTWPTTQTRRPDAVEVRFVCGYGGDEAIPPEAKAAVLHILSQLHENPAGGVAIPPAARRYLDTLEYGQVR